MVFSTCVHLAAVLTPGSAFPASYLLTSLLLVVNFTADIMWTLHHAGGFIWGSLEGVGAAMHEDPGMPTFM
jgi:hypothetical protein